MAKIDLEFLARQIERVINDVAGLKDDVTVVLARLDRIDATTHSLVTECARDAQPARAPEPSGREDRGAGAPGKLRLAHHPLAQIHRLRSCHSSLASSTQQSL